jgi:hypothetical protein
MHATKQIEIQSLRAVKLMLKYARSTKLIDTRFLCSQSNDKTRFLCNQANINMKDACNQGNTKTRFAFNQANINMRNACNQGNTKQGLRATSKTKTRSKATKQILKVCKQPS